MVFKFVYIFKEVNLNIKKFILFLKFFELVLIKCLKLFNNRKYKMVIGI